MYVNLGAPLVFRPNETTGNQILVTRAYDIMFHRLLTLRVMCESMTIGALITGHPGTSAFPSSDLARRTHHRTYPAGKTTFLNFMFARLVSVQRVIVLYNGSGIYIFYRGSVYRRNPQSRLEYLPLHKTGKDWRIWTLIDMDSLTGEPRLLKIERVWPIQAAYPNPVRFKNWVKYFDPAILGMPRWSEELLKG